MLAHLASARAWPFIVVATLCVVSLPFIHFTLDDAGITLRYAYNLAHHGVLSFNVDDRVYGTTSIAWALLCTPLMWADDPMLGLWLSKGASFACLAAACWIFASLVRAVHWMGRALFLIAVVASVPFAAFAWSGMEFGLGFLLLALFVRLWFGGGARALLGMSLVAVGLAFTRPDYCLLTVAPLLAASFRRVRATPSALLQLLPAAALAAGALAALWLYYGDPVPLPFYAKVLAPPRDPGLLAGLRRIGSWWLLQGGWAVGPLLLVWLTSKPAREFSARRLHVSAEQTWLLFSSAALLFVFYASRGGNIVMDTAGRYYAPFLTLFALLVAPVAEYVVTERPSWSRRARWFLPAGALAALAAVGLTLSWDANLRTRGRSRSLGEYATGMNRAYIPMGQYIAEHYPEGVHLMLHDAGLVPLFSRAHVLDLWSLNNREIIECRGACRKDVVQRYHPALVMQRDELLPPAAHATVVHETGPNPPGNRKLTLREVRWAE